MLLNRAGYASLEWRLPISIFSQQSRRVLLWDTTSRLESSYYAGQPIHYDFLFYFQAGNLEFLGLNLAWSVDVLSVLGLTSMLALAMALGELLFNSRVVGRVGAALFFFPGSLAFIPFLKSQGWLEVFVNQRHLPSAIGVFLLVLIFLVDRFRQTPDTRKILTNVSRRRLSYRDW